MIVTAAYKQADQDYLNRSTVKELTAMLTMANIKGRSKATTKAAKIELLLTAHFGYGVDDAGNITLITPTQTTEEALEAAETAPKKGRKQPTRAALNKKANAYDWMVVNLGHCYAIQHGFAAPGTNMCTARTLPAIARRLSKLISEWQCSYVDGTRYEFHQKYTATR